MHEVLHGEIRSALLALRSARAAARVLAAAARVKRLLDARAGFDPTQPRDELGRWTAIGPSGPVEQPMAGSDGRVRVAGAFDWGLVDLRDEESGGGHAIAEHVGETDAEMMARLRQDYYDFKALQVYRERDGSFPSVEAANKLVNATLARNASVVESVAGGLDDRKTVFAEFNSPTGREAYRSSPRSQPEMRDTYAVGVIIAHDGKQPKGFRIITAFPRDP